MSFLEKAYGRALERGVLLEKIYGGASCRSSGGFRDSVLAGYRSLGAGIVSEYKRCAPGGFTEYVDPWDFASELGEYTSCFSVLVEPYWFCGSPELIHFFSLRAPVLYKDFVATRGQLMQAACFNSSAVLLILDMVGWRTLDQLYSEARGLGLEALIEVSTGREAVEVAGSYEEAVIGVNSRDLRTLKLDYGRMLGELRWASERLPSRSLLIAESGIRSREQALQALRAGAQGLLIGTALMRNRGMLREIIEAVKPQG